MIFTSSSTTTNYLYAFQNTNNHILYDIPAGKPDSNLPRSLGPDTRPRVDQPAQKGPNCTFYAMNLIRARIGKHPCLELEKAQAAEIRFSKFRKEHSLNVGFNLIAVLEEMKKRVNNIPEYENITDIQYAERFLKTIPVLSEEKLMKEGENYYGHNAKVMLEEFINQDEFKDLKDYVNMLYQRDRMNILEEFLPSEVMHVLKESPHITGQCLERLMASQFRLESSLWNPEQGCKSLVKELKLHGPLYVGGDEIGRESYIDEPFELKEKISGRTIYAWKPGTQRRSIKGCGHVIILIGAKIINNKGYVYFIDPVDDSPISKHRKIYLISYDTLKSSITNDLFTLSQRMERCFAYYGNFQFC